MRGQRVTVLICTMNDLTCLLDNENPSCNCTTIYSSYATLNHKFRIKCLYSGGLVVGKRPRTLWYFGYSYYNPNSYNLKAHNPISYNRINFQL